MHSHDLALGLTTLQDAIERDPLVVSPEASIAQTVALMKQQSSCVLVKAGQKLLGILTERDVVQLTARGMYLSETPVVDVMTRNLITLPFSELQNPFAVLTLFQQYRIRHLPILDEQGHLMGLLTPQALRQTLQSTDLLRLRRIADVMNVQVITAPPSARVMALAQLMANHRVSCVVIVDAQNSATDARQNTLQPCPLGIVTERDIVKFQSQQLDLFELTAGQVMSTPLSCVSPEDMLWESHQTMQRLRVRRLVVAKEGKLAGIITQTSILSALNPVDLYDTIQVLQTELDRLRDKQLVSLEARSSVLTEQMQETEHRFQAIFNNMFQFTGLMTPDGTVIDVNQTALALGGISLEEVVGRPAWETYWWSISPETQAQFRRAIAQAAQGEFVRYEVDIRGAGGKLLSIDFSIRPLRDAEGNVTLLIPEGRDISDRKRAEQALQFQVEFDRLVANIANRFISLPSAELDAGIQRSLQDIGKFIGIDTSYVFQLSEGQSILSMSHEWITPGFPSQIDYVQTIPTAVFPWACEQLCRGEVLHLPNIAQLPAEAALDQQSWQRFNLKAILSIPLAYQDEVLGWVGFASFTREHHWSEDSIRLLSIFATTLTQVLQRQKSEQALQKSEQRFQAIFNNTFQFTGLMTLDGTLIEANQTALDFGGIQREDVIGLPFWEAHWWTISPETQARLREATERAGQGEFIRYEVDVLGVGGRVVTIDFSLRPLKDEQGNVILLVPEGRDITELKQVQRDLTFQVEFDRLVANIANRFLSLPSEELDAGIKRSLQEIGEFTGVDTSYVFQFSEDQSTLSMFHEWIATGFPAQIDNVQEIPTTAFPWGCEKLSRGEVLYLTNIDELPPEVGVDQQSFQRFNLKAILSIPLTYQEKVFGWVGFGSFTQEKHWSEDSIRLLSIFAATLSQVLQQQKSDQALQASEQRFRAIFNNTFQFMGLMTLDGTLIEANQTALDFGGIQREDVIGLPFWETYWWTISPETQTRLQEATQQAAQGEFIRYDVDVRGVSGQVVTIDFSLRPMVDDQGNVILLVPEGRDISALKQAEIELRESEQRYASLADAAPVGICRTDANGHCIYLNERWSSITGLPCCEGKGDGWLQGVYSEDRETVAAEWYQSIQEHRPFRMEFRFLRPDGQITWVLNQSIAEYDALGQVMGYVGTITDITERVQARQELQDSEERLRLALTSAKQGLYDLNIQTGDAIVNDDYALMLGYDPDSFQETNADWIERLHPEDGEPVAQTYQAYVRGEIPDYSVEFRQRMANGDWKWILSLGKIVEWDEAGNPLRMLGTHTDIDALKQAEQLKSELRVLEDILEATLAGYWDWDLQNNREYLSPTFKQMLGYEDHELDNVPESWQQLTFKEDLARIEANLEEHIQTRGEVTFHNEVRYRHRNGSVIWVICAGRVIDWDKTGQPLRMVGCHVDITQRKRAEEQLRSLNQELKRSNKDLEQFAYITSHDLQEPLRAVTAYTNLLLADYGDVLCDDNARKYTSYVLDGTQRMRELIRDLLTYSRVGSNELKRTSVDCNELLAEVQLNLQEAIAQSQAQITVGPLPVIEGDRTQLLQLFQNLLSNAIKFHQGDSPEIQVSAVQQSALQPTQQPNNINLREQLHWLFLVQDQGIGIRAKYLERIFDIFRRLHTREQFPGTGIGLSICQRVMERHGGDIWVESQFGEGSSFYFTFPTHQPTDSVDD